MALWIWMGDKPADPALIPDFSVLDNPPEIATTKRDSMMMASNYQLMIDNLLDLSLEDLMEIDVSLASRGQERLFDTPAAAYVLTGEDIRRSGARSIPEALRLVPGIEVARMDANKWGVASRGFNGRFANKLLVLIDGRPLRSVFGAGSPMRAPSALSLAKCLTTSLRSA